VPLAAQILPPKEGRLRRIAFAQLALPGRTGRTGPYAAVASDDDLSRLARGIPLWLAETFYFSAAYAPAAALAFAAPPGEAQHLVDFNAEWSLENLRQLVESSEEAPDYIVTGALRATSGDYEIVLRVWEVRSFRERKGFQARWTPATADTVLAQLHAQVRAYMEWSPASAALAYLAPTQPRPWLDTLALAAGLFLAEKAVIAPASLPAVAADVQGAAARAASGEAASLAFLTLQARAVRLGLAAPVEVPLAPSTLVNAARAAT
jgi:hypothetical protein